jgi:hypothetical protein
MTDTSTVPPIDPVISTIEGLAFRHILGWSAGLLAGAGLLAPGDEANYTKIGLGIFGGVSALVLSWWNKKGRLLVEAKLAAFHKVATPAQVAVVNAAVVPHA